jgi:predicted RecB family nuclease|tara:strand:+ start:113 stop:280 length:168 start_codon:yes stop_codon:yes gene_type:complete
MIHWAASVNDDWYTEALETVDPNLIERILAYNHDDCHATVALRRGVPQVDHAHGG